MIAHLTRLAECLPPAAESGAGEDDERRARATLAILVETALNQREGTPIPENPANCPNCDIPTLSETSPYCGPACREESAFVRQLRRSLAEGSVLNPDRQVAFGQNLWRLLGGGYPLRRGLIPPKNLAKVIGREDGRCQVCGAPAVTVDHTGSG